MCVCVYGVCVCVCVDVNVHVYMCARVHVFVGLDMQWPVLVCVCVSVYMCVWANEGRESGCTACSHTSATNEDGTFLWQQKIVVDLLYF